MLACLRAQSADRGHQEKKMHDGNGNPTDEPNPDYLNGRSAYFWICGNSP